jgi:HCOMODA/2-hydroxy-3-carboxy-muconic semialdehyde decarboxylase
MGNFSQAARALVAGNRILAHEGIVDAFGHVSMRHPGRTDRFLLSQSCSPELVTADDIMEFALDGHAMDARNRPLYAERFIHAAIYEARPDVNAVVHSHAVELIPFGITKTPLRPVVHVAARMGAKVPVWDIRKRFGDTNLLVVNNTQGRDLATSLGKARVVLMRGHGCTVVCGTLHRAVMTAIYATVNARVQLQAMQMGAVTYLSKGEIALLGDPANEPTIGIRRSWDYLCRRAGCEATATGLATGLPDIGSPKKKEKTR